jgi:hypothetical protein
MVIIDVVVEDDRKSTVVRITTMRPAGLVSSPKKFSSLATSHDLAPFPRRESPKRKSRGSKRKKIPILDHTSLSREW